MAIVRFSFFVFKRNLLGRAFVDFLDQTGDGLISRAEYDFIFELIKQLKERSKDGYTVLLPESLKDLDKNTLKILKKIYDLIRKSGKSLKEVICRLAGFLSTINHYLK